MRRTRNRSAAAGLRGPTLSCKLMAGGIPARGWQADATVRRAGPGGEAVKKTTVLDLAAARADRIRRDFTADVSKLNTCWCCDITCIATREGWLYLATVTRHRLPSRRRLRSRRPPVHRADRGRHGQRGRGRAPEPRAWSSAPTAAAGTPRPPAPPSPTRPGHARSAGPARSGTNALAESSFFSLKGGRAHRYSGLACKGQAGDGGVHRLIQRHPAALILRYQSPANYESNHHKTTGE
jgi:putative transposase